MLSDEAESLPWLRRSRSRGRWGPMRKSSCVEYHVFTGRRCRSREPGGPPSAGGRSGYDSNYLSRSDKTGANIVNGAPAAGPIDTGLLRVTPLITLTLAPYTKSKDVGAGKTAPFALQVGASGTYREFFNPLLSNQRNMSVNAMLGLAVLPGHEWSGSVSGTYSRAVQPTVLGNPDLSYNNDLVTGTAELAAHPHMGTLNWRLGYTIAGMVFEQSSGQPYSNLANTGYTRGRWRFSPRTSFLFDGQVSGRSYSDPAGSTFAVHSSIPIRARVGLEALLAPVVSVSGMIGYGTTLTQANYNGDPTVQNYSSAIGNIEVKLMPGGPPGTIAGNDRLLVSSVAIGYSRDFSPSFMGDYYGLDRGYLRGEYFFGGKFVVTLTGGVGTLEHPDIYFGSGTGLGASGFGQPVANAYTDVAADATAFAEYRIISSVGVNATLNYNETFSDTRLPVAPGSAYYYDENVRRIAAFLGVRWFM